MAFDGSGNYVPPSAPAFPAVGGTTIQASYYNQVINDIAAALSICFTRDGQGKPTADLDFNGKSVSNILNLTITGTLSLSAALGVAAGGTGLTATPTNGQLAIGNGVGFALGTITGGGGVSVTNGAGTIALGLSGLVTASGLTVATGTLLGRSTAGTGAIEAITIGTGLSLSGGTLSATGGGSSTIATLTFNNSGTGGASGTTYNGSTAKTISYNTVGAAPATPQVTTTASSSSYTPSATNDLCRLTALAANVTLNNPTGGPADGQGLVISIKDNGTPRTITYGTQYRGVGVTLPTTTVSNKILYLGMVWNAGDSKWDVVAAQQQ